MVLQPGRARVEAGIKSSGFEATSVVFTQSCPSRDVVDWRDVMVGNEIGLPVGGNLGQWRDKGCDASN